MSTKAVWVARQPQFCQVSSSVGHSQLRVLFRDVKSPGRVGAPGMKGHREEGRDQRKCNGSLGSMTPLNYLVYWPLTVQLLLPDVPTWPSFPTIVCMSLSWHCFLIDLGCQDPLWPPFCWILCFPTLFPEKESDWLRSAFCWTSSLAGGQLYQRVWGQRFYTLITCGWRGLGYSIFRRELRVQETLRLPHPGGTLFCPQLY